MLEYAGEAIGLMRNKTGVCSTITEDLPPLIAELEKILYAGLPSGALCGGNPRRWISLSVVIAWGKSVKSED
jgi:hypothetical protein